MKFFRFCLVLFIPALIVFVFFQVGSYLSNPAQKPENVDIILALGGDNGERVSLAAKLYKQGFANNIMLTGMEDGATETNNNYINWRLQFLIKENIPRDSVILEIDAKNSWQEAVNSLTILKLHNWESIIIVSDPPHMQRLNLVWSKVFAGSGKKFILIKTEPPWWNPHKWWENSQSGQFVVTEIIKISYYLFKY